MNHHANRESARHRRLRVRVLYCATLALTSLVLIGSLQAFFFYWSFAPRVEAANANYARLVEEQAGQHVYEQIHSRLQGLDPLLRPDARAAWNRFVPAFSVAPVDAIELLRSDVRLLEPRTKHNEGAVRELETNLDSFHAIYADPYRQLLSDLSELSPFFQPIGSILANRSGYRRDVTMNRALYLARIGEIGTARVLLSGLYSAHDDPEFLGTVNFMLGRLQFEMLIARRDPKFLYQSRLYLLKSLQADPTSQLSQKFLDFLLSIPPQPSTLEVGAGTPRNAAQGEGTAPSSPRRKF